MKFIYIVLLLALISGCSGESANDSSSGGGGTGTGSGSSTDAKLSLVVRRNLKDNTTKTLVDTCEIPSNATLGDNLTCTVQVPELLLHYSEIDFTVSTNSSSTCTEVIMIPYYYRKSTSATFRLDGSESDTDCSVDTDANCWGGAAPGFGAIEKGAFVALEFPGNRGYYFLTKNTLVGNYRLMSTEERSETNRDRDLINNTGVTNNLPPGSRAASINTTSVRYVGVSVGGTFQDYQVICRDDFGEVNHSITLTIGDDDTMSTPSSIDTFYDWGF